MAERRCKKHPEHKQTKGVCPNCLRERLDQLSASSSLDACSTTSSSSSSPSMASSVCETPKRQQEPLRKSRSLASVIGEEVKEELREKRKSEMKMMKNKKKKKEIENKEKKEKERFWARLIKSGGGGWRKDEDVSLKHSKTLKEKSSSSFWLIFS